MICALLLPPGAAHRSLFISPPGDLNCSAMEVGTTWRKDELGFGWWQRLWGLGGMEVNIESPRRGQVETGSCGSPRESKKTEGGAGVVSEWGGLSGTLAGCPGASPVGEGGRGSWKGFHLSCSNSRLASAFCLCVINTEQTE